MYDVIEFLLIPINSILAVLRQVLDDSESKRKPDTRLVFISHKDYCV